MINIVTVDTRGVFENSFLDDGMPCAHCGGLKPCLFKFHPNIYICIDCLNHSHNTSKDYYQRLENIMKSPHTGWRVTKDEEQTE